MDSYVEDHLHWRMMEPGDMEELARLRHQIEAFDDTMITTVEGLLFHDGATLDGGHCVGGWDNYGSLMAYGWNIVHADQDHARVTLAGGVHPTHRYLSIGRKLFDWQVARGIEWRDAERPGMDLWLGCYVEGTQAGLHHMLKGLGFQEERHFIDMQRPLDVVPVPRMVDGVSFVAFDDANSEEVHQLHHLCFGSDAEHDHWESSLSRVRPDWSWVAINGKGAVGYVLSGEDDAAAVDGVVEGWTQRIGVHPAYRRQGIASALLERTMESMAHSQCRGAGIGVDTDDTGVPEMLRDPLGYEDRDSVLLMSKTIPGTKSVR
ncbi:MAG: GNAT family N-acetyltransferase [Propionibacteriaceae bacterium]|nr:GNAT family N-acetyltransferase [Propionibacteriaceae bacterium]